MWFFFLFWTNVCVHNFIKYIENRLLKTYIKKHILLSQPNKFLDEISAVLICRNLSRSSPDIKSPRLMMYPPRVKKLLFGTLQSRESVRNVAFHYWFSPGVDSTWGVENSKLNDKIPTWGVINFLRINCKKFVKFFPAFLPRSLLWNVKLIH